jgi:hypothetical protein
MKLLPNHKLSKEQLEAQYMVEKIFNTTDFEAWFVRSRFTELAADVSTITLLEKRFRGQQYRFIWQIVDRPWWKFWNKSFGKTEGYIITTYRQAFQKMSLAERSGHLAHEIMLIVGFPKSDKPSAAKSVPVQVADYVQKAVAFYYKASH